MIVWFASKNNVINSTRERQRINANAWNRTQKQQWEIQHALNERKERQASKNADKEQKKEYLESHH